MPVPSASLECNQRPHSPQVRGQAHQIPLTCGPFQAPDTEAAEAHDLLDPAIHSDPAVGLARTELARAYVGTVRLKLLKIGVVILRNTWRVRFLLASACSFQKLFFHVTVRLAPG